MPDNQDISIRPDSACVTAIADLAKALGSGSSKLCEALAHTYGRLDVRCISATEVDRRLQFMLTDLQS
jgi:hypothetical protein